MFETIQLLSLGVAVCVDTFLLLILLEPRNRRFTPTPVQVVAFGVWLWHVGLAALLFFLMSADGAGPLASLSLFVACAGALLMPCAMTHCLARLWQSGLALRKKPNPWHLLAYVPMLFLTRAANLEAPTAADPLGPVAFGIAPYLIWSSAVNVATVVILARLAQCIDFAPARPFFKLLALLAALRVAVHLAILLTILEPPYARLVVYLSPVASMVLFGYFVLRHNILYLTLERGTLYAAFVAAAFLLHQILFVTLTADWPTQARVIVIVLEAALLLGFVLAIPSLRQRCAESMRYLLGARVSLVRSRLRQLGADLAARTDTSPLEKLDWFVAQLRQALGVEYVTGILFDGHGAMRACFGEAGRIDEHDARILLEQMDAAKIDACTHRDAPSRETSSWLQRAAASLAVVKRYRNLTGVLLLGRHARNRELNAEEVGAVLLLIEELIITIDNTFLVAERLDAERRAAQGEKLAALGLLASSVAHEVKNPLSAIKTIATLLVEDLGDHDPRAEDLRLIIGEVDRLAATTTQLLDFARSRRADGAASDTSAAAALTSTLALLRHLARERDVVLDVNLAADLGAVQGEEHALREIFFNLLSNAVDAAGPGGRVEVICSPADGHLVTVVRDTGPGVAAEIRHRLFEPFLTTKDSGTGLGLHAVGRRVRELGGSITLDSGPEHGAVFTVRLPIVTVPENPA